MLLRAAQVAMMALLEAREHLARPLAQLELLYDRMIAYQGPPPRLPVLGRRGACAAIGACPCVVARVHPWRRFCAYGPANTYVYDC